ncbi:MAG TPA: response regulator transcription factor [Anaerolineales bacterium]
MKQVLLADDNAELCSALRLALETRLDLRLITEARDMEHVLAQVEDTRPDCIVLDWELPGHPRRERVRVLRALVPSMKIIVTSARPEAREEAMSEGVDAFAAKSESPLMILEAMRVCAGEKE